ncbi:PREDICTED: putative FBD-associated F-box protein At5g56440 [Camelina sativa]|uniref:FBD-associated F-box protein At5g56440 n=1 Tax=Camelina sativa TaxID=90675 RepID=A0ABM0XAL8_CAMSA|nr:PREDICTED: putative FBD-associated F-box protein At5g56440 [Camelina sativa]
MDRISLLPDDVILKILSSVLTKVAVSTSILSKRWRYLWKHVPKLEYHDPSGDSEHWRASRFVDKFLLLHEAPVLETLHLTLSRNFSPTDIETWIHIAISRGVRKLHIFRYRPSSGLIRLPRSLYTCETLVTLNLHAECMFTVDYVPLTISFRSLKALYLYLVKFLSDEIIHRILSGCPVLEELRLVVRGGDDGVKTFTIAVPSLQRLTAIDLGSQVPGDDDVGFVIKAPSLKSLFVLSRCSGFCSLAKMPDLVKAYIKLGHGDSKKFMGCLTSTKQLTLCLQPTMGSCPIGVFNQLVSLKLCACSIVWCRSILNHTPKLRFLRVMLQEARLYPTLHLLKSCWSRSVNVQTQWEQPTSVPECLISSLEAVEWMGYQGTQVEKNVAMYLLENSRQLKIMVISSLHSTNDIEKLKMLQELSSTQRISTKCQLRFT